MSDEIDVMSLREGTERAVRAAGAMAMDAFRRVSELEVSRKGHQDFVTEADHAVEEQLRRDLHALLPGSVVFGEEAGADGTLEDDLAAGPPVWLVDPIDGTGNFIRGMPLFCVSVGLVTSGRSSLGLVYDPARDEMFSAVAGAGMTVNGAKCRARDTADISESVLALGHSGRVSADETCRMTTGLIQRGASVRKLGSAALASAWVAAGRLDAYVELHLNAWDFGAALCLGDEAGAITNVKLSRPVLEKGAPFIICAPGIASELSEIVGVPLGA